MEHLFDSMNSGTQLTKEQALNHLDSLKQQNDSLRADVASLRVKFELLKPLVDAIKIDFDAINKKFDAWNNNFDALRVFVESSISLADASKRTVDALTDKTDATNEQADVQSLIADALARNFHIQYQQQNIPFRMADEIKLLKTSGNVTLGKFMTELKQSRSTVQRDLRILKKLGWISYHGSRNNGYFVLTEKGMGVLKQKEN